MRAKRPVTAVLAAMIIVALGVAAPADDLTARPRIAFGPNVPGDFQALARYTWTRFADAFPARWGCLPAVNVTGAWQQPDRASYDPTHRLVTVRIPGPPANLQAALVHEFAHHLEFACPEIRRLRPRFLSAQGFPPGAAWFRGASWERTPSEQFAEATVRVVLGRRSGLRTFATPEALRAIRDWAHGR